MNHEPPNTRLSLSSEEMRALGYRVIDMIVEHVETMPEKPVGHAHKGARPGLEARLREPVRESDTSVVSGPTVTSCWKCCERLGST